MATTHPHTFQAIIASADLPSAVERIITRWDAPHDAHERFRRWAAQTTGDLKNAESAASQLKLAFRALHEEIARTLVQFGHVDEGLVSRRAFVAHLVDLIEPHVPRAAIRHTLVRTAA